MDNECIKFIILTSLQHRWSETAANQYPTSRPYIYIILKVAGELIKDRMADVVALWDIALSNGIHKVKFEHGTTSGKRTITIDDEVIRFKKF